MLSVSTNLCCGCGNCALVCPKGCISLTENENGFLLPTVNTDSCISCGKCEKVCPVLDYTAKIDETHTAFAAYAKTPKDRFNGSSGGVFGGAAKHFLKSNGIVYGAAFDEHLQLKTTKAENEDELTPLFKSKYLQCDIGSAFIDIRQHLENGKKVLYTATPCQIQALKKYLGKTYENLWTIDFVCHGVPSQKFFDLCREYTQTKQNIQIENYQFRAKKKHGSTPHYYKMKYRKNEKSKEKTSLYLHSPFYYGFQKYITLRESCYHCPFAKSNRPSDITIGDFHAIDKYVAGINRFDGVSTVVINTEKGATLWKEIQPDFVEHPIDFSVLLENKELMTGPTPKPKNYDVFWSNYRALSFKDFAKKHLNGKKEWMKRLYYHLPAFTRKILKKVIGI